MSVMNGRVIRRSIYLGGGGYQNRLGDSASRRTPGRSIFISVFVMCSIVQNGMSHSHRIIGCLSDQSLMNCGIVGDGDFLINSPIIADSVTDPYVRIILLHHPNISGLAAPSVGIDFLKSFSTIFFKFSIYFSFLMLTHPIQSCANCHHFFVSGVYCSLLSSERWSSCTGSCCSGSHIPNNSNKGPNPSWPYH